MTFSIVARCAETRMFGIAVASSSPAVAARCAHARAGVGAVASQNITDPTLGPKLLDLMARGMDSGSALQALRASSPHMAFRQVTAVDASSGTAIHSGSGTLGIWAERQGSGVACAGNLLANADVPQAMLGAFEAVRGQLGDRLLTAMRAGVAAGGEAGPIHSAGMQLVRDVSWPIADLRVDWTDACPVQALSDIWDVYRPQLEDYVTRALDPGTAPGYHV